MSDPRERIEANGLVCERNDEDRYEFWLLDSEYSDSVVASWKATVAFARAILAADKAWLDSQTPTLEGLRAKYPGRSIGMARVVCGPTCCWRARVGPCESPHIVTEIAALRWLAAKLEELT